MDSKLTIEFLTDKVEGYRKMYQSQRNKNKWLSFSIKMASAISAALISVLLGLSKAVIDSDVAKNISLGLGAFITVVNVWDTFFNHRALYIRATASMVNCILLQDEIAYMKKKHGDSIAENELNKIHVALKKIIMDNNSHWIELKKIEKVHTN